VNQPTQAIASQALQPRDTIQRPRLLSQVHAAPGHRLVLVTGPSGFGKSVFLAEAASEHGGHVAWLSLDGWDKDPRELLIKLARALDPASSVEIQPVSTNEDLRRHLRRVLWSLSGKEEALSVFLDGFEAIEASKGAVELVEELIASVPPGSQVFVSGNGLPDLKPLPRLAARGDVLWLGIDDLAFDVQEVERYFRDVRGVAVPEARLQDLLARSDGWPAYFSLLSVLESGEVQSTPKGELFLEELLRETFERQPTAMREFLLSISFLPAGDADLFDELMGNKKSLALLKEAERRSLFLSRTGGPSPSYRIHVPFRAYLKGRLKAEKPKRFLGLSETAGRIFEARGDAEAAVPYYLDAALWEDAERVIAGSAESLLSFGRSELLAGWLGALPRDRLRADPALSLLLARSNLDSGRLDEALQTVAEILEHPCPPALQGAAMLYRGVCLSRKGQHQEALRAGRLAVSMLSRAGAPTSLLTEAHLRLGIAIGASGQFARAVPSLRKAIVSAESLGDVRTASIAADALGDAHGNLGQIGEARIYLERARQGWASLGNDFRLVLTLNNLGVMYSLQGEYELSSRLLSEAIEGSRRVGNARIEAIATLSLADVRRDTGAYEQAIALYEDGLEQARKLGEAYFIDYAVDALGMTYMLMGDLQRAEGLIRQAAANVTERGGSYENGLLSLSLGILAHLRGEFGESAARLEYALRVFKGAGAAREEARTHFHLAHVCLATNSRRRALAALQEVARLTAEIGYSAFLAADARRCPALIAFAASKRIGDGLFVRLREEQERRAIALEMSLTPAYPAIEALSLGTSSVSIDGHPITESEWSSLKSKEMFFYFLSRKDPCSRDECCAALWPEFDSARATSNFHSTLYRLRSATYFDVIANAGGRYRLNPAARFEYDARTFESLVQEGDSLPAASPQRLVAYEKAATLYGGPFGRDFYSEWAEAVRLRLEDKYLRVLGVLAEAAFSAEAYEKSAVLCERILAVDEGNDEARCLQIDSFLALGDRVSAVRHFDAYRRYLRAEGGSPPSRRLAEVARRVTASSS
jgi:ATP/maltotriose-dependent transcriptional regulator MalT/DNA-binding SARP family transcriptional activator